MFSYQWVLTIMATVGVGGAGKAMQRSGMIHVVKLKEAVPVLQENKDYTLKIGTLTSGPHHVVIHLTLTCTDGMEEQHVLGWGTARHGQIGPHKDPSTGKPVPFLPSPTPLFSADSQGNESLVSSALGTHHTVLLLSSGRLQPLGSNRKGQLDGVDSLQDVAAVGCTWNGTYAAVRRGNSWSIISAGNHNKGQLGRPVQFGDNNPHGHSLAVHFPFSHETHSLVKMACGSEHILCLFSRKEADSNDRPLTEVWGWGWNEHGNLGIGTIQDTDAPIKIWPTAADHRIAVDVWAGNGTSWILV
ncbi:hypothetical protein NM688_g2587 [Phlebia brevispora]|uniref:Uncharacterized protein n=1 Tax=Phlebia brevispora TaxID=194682 RepID=A0ACC1T8D4_9APHY|nr:hypothetical protein NM688_g2587 [Phlebia brevispora]